MDCEYCKISLKSKYILKNHLVNNKACLKLRGLTMTSKFMCNGCNTTFMNNTNLTLHLESCKKYFLIKIQEENEEKIQILKKETEEREEILKQENVSLQTTISFLSKKLEQNKIDHDKYVSLQFFYSRYCKRTS